MPNLLEYIIVIFTSMFASTGFWTYITNKRSGKNDKLELLKGLAHDRIIQSGKEYISRGCITYDEYEDFMKYLYEPYAKFGGNGLAERVMEDVKGLPMKHGTIFDSVGTDCSKDHI